MNEALEKAIDEAGRDKVFARARGYGWTGGGAPEWIWWGIVREIQEGKSQDGLLAHGQGASES